MKEFLLQQRLSKRTIVMYMYWINKFIDFGKGDISNRILAYKEYCMENYSIQTQKVIFLNDIIQNMCLKKKNNKIYQTDLTGQIYEGKDIILTPKELNSLLLQDLNLKNISKDKEGWIIYNEHLISIKNVSYLGYSALEDRSLKKRVQFSLKLIDSYKKKPENKIILGNYINEKNERLYVMWTLNSKTKIGKSKSSHVNVLDLQNAFKFGSFSKIDINGNLVEVFKPEYLYKKLNNVQTKHPFQEFGNFIKENNSTWVAKKCISIMKEAGYNHAKQTEWAGWYLEFLASEFFQNNDNVQVPSVKKFGSWQPDAFYEVPIELKVHNNVKKDIPGNDFEGVKKAIEEYGRIALFVVLGNATMETDDFEVSKWRKKMFNEEYVHKQKRRKLKEKMTIEEIGWVDTFSKDDLYNSKKFSQGKNSNGKSRKEKIMFSTEMLNIK